MEIWTAFILGFLGSLHCLGMCGPLALALSAPGNPTMSFVLGRVAYNLGRILTYSLLGVVFGLIGRTLAVAGLQRGVSLLAGVAILVVLAASSRFALATPVFGFVGWLKASLGQLLRQRTLGSVFLFGMLNGLLPCGLVYAACAGAAAESGVLRGLEYMIVFGLGTVPMMLGISFAGHRLRPMFQFKFQKALPVCIVVLGVLLILRGMSLDIPYLSPNLSAVDGKCSACR